MLPPLSALRILKKKLFILMVVVRYFAFISIKTVIEKQLKSCMIQGARCINKSSTFYYQAVRRVLIFSLNISTIPTSCTVACFLSNLEHIA